METASEHACSQPAFYKQRSAYHIDLLFSGDLAGHISILGKHSNHKAESANAADFTVLQLSIIYRP